MADGAGDNVAHHKHGKSGDGDATQDHQDLLEPVERAPLQVSLLLQDEATESVHDRFQNPE
jgi:hypothetical protein